MSTLLAELPVADEHETLPIIDTHNCEQCGGSFEPRAGSGGKPQRFCSKTCRAAFHANASQRSPTCNAEKSSDAVQVLAKQYLAQAASAAPDNSDDFDWGKEEEDGTVLLRKQPCTAIYWNAGNQIVIRQESHYGDEDPFVFFDPHNVPAVIERLQLEYDAWRKGQERHQ